MSFDAENDEGFVLVTEADLDDEFCPDKRVAESESEPESDPLTGSDIQTPVAEHCIEAEADKVATSQLEAVPPAAPQVQPAGLHAFYWLLPCLVALAAVTANTLIYYLQTAPLANAVAANILLDTGPLSNSHSLSSCSHRMKGCWVLGQPNCSCGWQGRAGVKTGLPAAEPRRQDWREHAFTASFVALPALPPADSHMTSRAVEALLRQPRAKAADAEAPLMLTATDQQVLRPASGKAQRLPSTSGCRSSKTAPEFVCAEGKGCIAFSQLCHGESTPEMPLASRTVAVTSY